MIWYDHYHTGYTWEVTQGRQGYTQHMDLVRSLPYKIHMGSNSGKTRIYSAHGLGTITTIQDTHGK